MNLTVQANTIGGAKEQLERQYGAQQIINLREINPGRGGSSSDCFVVTAVFDGNAHHPTVSTLRNWRDTSLVHLPFGRQLIAAYYILGPSAAAIIARSHYRYLLRSPLNQLSRLLDKHKCTM